MTGDVRVDLAGHTAVVELRRPPANFFDTALITELADTYEALDRDPSCRAIVLCSQGKHFCAGADFGRPDQGNAVLDDTSELYAQALRLFRCQTPVVAAVQGAAIGGGLGLALSADFRVGGPGSRFAANFSRLGFHPGFGISVTLPAVVGQQKALDYLLTGRRFKGEEAHRAGLLDELADDVRPRAIRLADSMASSAPLAVVSIKQTMRQGLIERVAAALDRENREQTRLRATPDFAEGLAASSQRRTPRFTGALPERAAQGPP
ncbi:enoyl-CoA hydratase/isomerase family protein [Actinomadura sp. WMMA1423]|uniref:enoyl-CoA hydratase/isomerase family protein n=1 Tax=Actinomadura sp. WMMA1423 TaxID=2591108 RepID=UPI0011474434|nr:enoyl-CoA hydratase/isomerase family protein [Actinomadura sp. WMMA1423]